jgi:ubiquinol-cytochrome c reductase subunit 6
MGITDFFTDLMASVSFQEAHAEAPAEEPKDEGGDGGEEEKSDESDGEKGDEGGEDEAEEEAGAEAEEEEEDDEPVDIKPKLEAGQSIQLRLVQRSLLLSIKTTTRGPKLTAMVCTECARSAQCAPYKHHYEECVERVTAMHEDPDYKGPKEDCVEECMLRPLFLSSATASDMRADLLRLSLPPPTLRNRLRRTQAVQIPQVKCQTQRDGRAAVLLGCLSGGRWRREQTNKSYRPRLYSIQ